MKPFLYRLVPVFLLLCTACTEAEIVLPGSGGDDPEEGVPFRVKNLGMWMEVESRSVVTGGPGETNRNPNPLTGIGICVTKQNSSGTEILYNNAVGSQQFVYNPAGSPPLWELAEGEETLLLYSEKGTVYGYAPAEKSVSLAGIPKALLMNGVKVLDEQKFYFSDGNATVDAATDVQWETDQEDYLYCTAADQVDRWHPEVSLTMNHALAKVSFRVPEVNAGSSFAGCRVAKIVLKSNGGFKKSAAAQLSLVTGETTGTITPVDLLQFTAGGDKRVVGTSTDVASEVPVQAFGLVIPVSNVGISLELTLDDGRTFNMVPGADSDVLGTFTASWEKGYNYIYNIRMSPQGIEIADVKVAGWNDGGSVDIPVE